MDREVFERAGIPERDWLAAWEAPGTTCRFFRHVLELEEPLRTGVIIIGAALVFTAIDFGVGWMLSRRGQAETLD